jgi:hypothetical protein
MQQEDLVHKEREKTMEERCEPLLEHFTFSHVHEPSITPKLVSKSLPPSGTCLNSYNYTSLHFP